MPVRVAIRVHPSANPDLYSWQNVVKTAFFAFSQIRKEGGGAEGQTRTVDTGIFSAVLYHLSYLGLGFYYRIRRGGCQGGNSLEQHFDACSTTAGGRFIVEGDMPSP